MMKYSIYFLLGLFLTATTQVGGLVLLMALFISYKVKKSFRFKKTTVFISLYLFVTFIIVPLVAPIFGREQVRHNSHLYPTTYATVLLNRNYVRPKLNSLLQNASAQLRDEKIELRYLDANFPFIDGFPLLPHIIPFLHKSVAYIYVTPSNLIVRNTRLSYG